MTEVEWGDVRGHQWKACKAPVGPEPTRAMRKRLEVTIGSNPEES